MLRNGVIEGCGITLPALGWVVGEQDPIPITQRPGAKFCVPDLGTVVRTFCVDHGHASNMHIRCRESSAPKMPGSSRGMHVDCEMCMKACGCKG